MEQSPSRGANKQYAQVVQKLTAFYGTQRFIIVKSPPPFPILSQMNPSQTLKPYFSKFRLNIIFPFMSRSSEWPISFRLSTQNVLIYHVLHARCMSHPSHLPLFNRSNNIS
jgi:hypothetical protein